MKRTSLIWITFAACLAVVLLAMGWISREAVRLEREQRQALVATENRMRSLRASRTGDRASGMQRELFGRALVARTRIHDHRPATLENDEDLLLG